MKDDMQTCYLLILTVKNAQLIDNKMILNPSKTKVLLVTDQRLEKKLDSQILNLMTLGNSIAQVNSDKLLRLIINSKLNFKEHTDELSRKLAQRIGVLKNIKENLPIRERKLFYNSMIKPICFMYVSIVWGSKKSIRFTASEKSCPCDPRS